MKHQLFLFFFVTLKSSITIGLSEELHITHHISKEIKPFIKYTEQIFSEIAAIKQVLEHKIREKATGCSQQTYFDAVTGALHQEFRDGTGLYEIIFSEDGFVEINTRYITKKAPIVNEINDSWFKKRRDAFSQCAPHNSVYPVVCKTTLSQNVFVNSMLAAEQAVKQLNGLS